MAAESHMEQLKTVSAKLVPLHRRLHTACDKFLLLVLTKFQLQFLTHLSSSAA